MNLKRTVYHFAGNDYEATDIITFVFYVQRVSINNFLNLNYSDYSTGLIVRNMNYSIGDFELDYQHTNVDRAIKAITITCTAAALFLLLKKLGKKEWQSQETRIMFIRKSELRSVQYVADKKFNGISVFDPVTKKQWYTSGSPKKIEGRQAIINGKLWRKYYNTNPIYHRRTK
jgi:hypothetical protein